ncbi:hypothetical protein CPB84DRAFT_1817005 [Gymnopilus junonius]|uniref:MULE transposase domain-containing protein n=1 Tax=Gymnopilus junonius TaxID=109634 RepID=A0A9P5TIA0_GYMJU|nr:hypothetical protein CPB84DRAFT_1817005 [Gymnopilus junonius]
MDRFDCNGYLHITMSDHFPSLAGIIITHHLSHWGYLDISITEDVEAIIKERVNMPASKIWEAILLEGIQGQVTEKQVHARWASLNEEQWKMDDDQVKSAIKLLEKKEGHEIEIIPVQLEEGIDAVTFTFKGVLDVVGEEIVKVAMDSTWKTNAAGYELYGFIGELNGQAIPLAFCFTASTNGKAPEGAKDCLLHSVIKYIAKRCPNIEFTLSDKYTTEIDGFQKEIPKARHQLCHWHAITYVEEQLAQDKPPAAYSAPCAHEVFDFIDPTWVPGISAGWLEDSIHEDDAECPKPSIPASVQLTLESILDI